MVPAPLALFLIVVVAVFAAALTNAINKHECEMHHRSK